MRFNLIVAMTLMAAGRAMTLLYIGRAGDGGSGDPPETWLMPLIGDAVIGIAAIGVAALLVLRPTAMSWLVAIVWNAVAAFDALAAFVVETTAPWPAFFMIEWFGRSMFFAAAAMHLVLIALLAHPSVRARFGVDSGTAAVAAG